VNFVMEPLRKPKHTKIGRVISPNRRWVQKKGDGTSTEGPVRLWSTSCGGGKKSTGSRGKEKELCLTRPLNE